MGKREIVGYHVTTRNKADAILNSFYMPSSGEEHYLGKGVYMFEGYEDATKIVQTSPELYGDVILINEIECQNCECLDLDDSRSLDMFRQTLKTVVNVVRDDVKKRGITISGRNIVNRVNAFVCDYLRQEKGYKVILRSFQVENPDWGEKLDFLTLIPELKKDAYSHLPYFVRYICVGDIESIVNTYLENFEEAS